MLPHTIAAVARWSHLLEADLERLGMILERRCQVLAHQLVRIRNVLGFQGERTVDDAIDEVRGLLSSGVVSDFTSERFHNAKWLSMNASRAGAA